MKKAIIDKIRDSFHVIGGFTIGYWGASHSGLFNHNNFSTEFGRIFLAVTALTIFLAAIGAIFEFITQQIDKEIIPNTKDVIRTAAGGFIAGLATIFTYIPILLVITTSFCLIAIGFEVIRIIKKKKKK
jgi:hypothetical protein